MPVLSGLEFICECRAREISMDYIVLSAHEDFTYVQKALRLGVIDYISKLQLEPEECGEVFLRAAEHIRKRKEKEQQMQAGGRINRKKTETVADQEEKEQWRKLWEETASLTWIYNIEETQKLCNLWKAIPTSQKQEYRYTMQTLQEIQNAFGIFMEEQVQNGEGQAVTEILILKAVLFIEDHLVDSEVKAEQIADAVGMSRSYFSVCFKKCTGYSVNSYIRKERIALACRLLRENPQISAEQMADAVGYHDEKYFVKLFQQSMGIGFAEYKKQLKRQEF